MIYCIILFVSFTAKLCVPISEANVLNATHNGSFTEQDRQFNSYIAFTCDKGFKYSDGATIKVKRCDENGKWAPSNADFPTCDSE